MLPKRDPQSDKRTYGTVAGIGGSRGMAGSVAMAGKAALLAGAGLVKLAVPDPILETVAGFYPEYTTIPCPANTAGQFVSGSWTIPECNAAFLGPGLGRSEELSQFVVSMMEQMNCPLVLDADALVDQINTVSMPASCVLTPHSGEFARLTGRETPPETDSVRRRQAAQDYAGQHNVIVVLKGHRTIITDGCRLEINTTGNPGMATGGSGDVLTGIIAGFLAQRFLPVFETVKLAVYLHGLAGDIAAEKYGEYSVTAAAILEAVPAALMQKK